jgi:hypothetical protein
MSERDRPESPETAAHPRVPGVRESLLAGTGAALFITALTVAARRWGWHATDFDQLRIAGQALLDRRDPYVAVLEAGLPHPLYYPLPAVMLTLPLALLPRTTAHLVFAALTAFIAGYGLRRLGWWSLLAVISPVWWGAAFQGQLAPALAGAAMVPSLGLVLAAKPNVGLALWLSRPSRRAALGMAVLLLLSIAMWPGWLGAWFQTIQTAPHFRAPITRPGGFLLLLALLRWRSPSARLLTAWAVIPRTESLYDMLPLFLVAESAASAAFLVVCSLLALVGMAILPATSTDLTVRLSATWPVLLLLMYLPALLVVLSPILDRKLRRQ